MSFLSRDYHVTFRRMFPIGLWNVDTPSSLFTLGIGTLKIYVADICRMDLKTLSSQNVKIKNVFTTFCIGITT